LLNIPVTTTLHDDPSFVSDVDALEDWEDFESLTHFADNQGGLKKIHPFGKELIKFRETDMPFLKEEIPMYQNFPTYLNRIYKTLGMDYEPFESNGNYISPNANAPEVAQAYHWYQKKCAEKTTL
jgi:hypothetical protein